MEWLLEELCTELGICLPPAARKQLLFRAPASAVDFAVAVFRAEGLAPREHGELYRTVLARVTRAYAAQSRVV